VKKNIFFSVFLHLLLLGFLIGVAYLASPFWLGGRQDGDQVTWIDLQQDGVGGQEVTIEPVFNQTQGLSTEKRSLAKESVGIAGGNQTEGLGFDQTGDSQASVLALIRQKILRNRHYPEGAQKSEIEGKTLVSFSIGDDGRPVAVKLLQSSGSALLDADALDTIHRGAPYSAYPGELVIPLNYELDEE
jgi:TonB family protein